MTSLDSICDELLKIAKVTPMGKVASAKLSKSMRTNPSNKLRKMAYEIRELTKPVEVTYSDLNSFIREIYE